MDYLELTKPRILPMVLVVTAAGFYLASGAGVQIFLLIHTLIGSALATGGALALNQASEEDLDARMIRTQKRPLPAGRLLKLDALLFGSAITILGVAYLAVFVNPFTALLIAATGGLYLFLYTPLKRTTSLNSVVGAVPGAMPPLIGWAAATGALSIEAFVVFSIMFLWQIPHALAIAVMYREDFARADIKLLPVEDPGGASTGRQVHLLLHGPHSRGHGPGHHRHGGPGLFRSLHHPGNHLPGLRGSHGERKRRRVRKAAVLLLPDLSAGAPAGDDFRLRPPMDKTQTKNKNRRTGILLFLFIVCLAGFAWTVALIKN